MLTKNGRKMLLSRAVDKYLYLKCKDGSYANGLGYGQVSYMMGNVQTNYKDSSGCCFFRFGNGTTKETENDYMIESLIDNLTINSATCTKLFDNYDDCYLQYRASVTNNTNENITISEIGLESYLNDYEWIWYHKTFEPITLAPNETKTFAIDLM